ncbi:MAG: HupE/UreJ family protein [Polyangiaceae bacterium]|nr:HupE/UreJ family protein [Polyangiaceae bacterium]
MSLARRRALSVALCVAASAPPCLAHDFDPGVLAISEAPDSAGVTHRFRLTQPVDARGGGARVVARFPARCVVDEAAGTLACGERGLEGGVSLTGLSTSAGRVRMIVTLRARDGRVVERPVERDGLVDVTVGGDDSPRRPLGWVTLGAHHLVTGPDHLAFLLGLLGLVASRRALVLAITAFSAGHAASLALATLGLLSVPTAPTEALIGLSVLLVGLEALRRGRAGAPPSSLARAPLVASLVFGLLHGLGFASALGDRGFPREGLWRALGAFHLGVEAAQLALVALAAGLWWALGRLGERARARARVVALYGVGAGGAYWTIDRVARLLGG